MQYFILYPIITFFLGSCITYTDHEAARLELPMIQPGEKVLDYKGYTDIVYGQSLEMVPDMETIAYSVSYDEWHKIPKWVAYSLSREELGSFARRKGKQFHQDPGAPFQQAERLDYRGSGWTNGHLAPAADFSWSDKAMDDTFYYTNICPQDETLNGGSWHRLENRIRDWAQKFGEIYIVSGPIVGKAENGTIGTNNVTVPDAFFKAVLARDEDSYQTVAFIMENSAATQPYPQCCLTVNDLESIIGIDLFCAIDDAIEESVEGKVNIRFWGM